MWLSISKSKSSTSLYVIKSIYENGKHSSKIVERLGTIESLAKKLDGQDPIEWAKNYILQLNQLEKEEKINISVSYSSSKLIAKNVQHSFNGGYLFLQQIYHELGLSDICKAIMRDDQFTFDLNAILSRLIYSRLIFPSAKLATDQFSKKFIEQKNFEIPHIYRALEVIAENTDFIQARLYANSRKISQHNTGILYFDCTHYFLEIEQEEGLEQYGMSKEQRANPIVQMGLFMDEDGIPLAFCINKGNSNEQLTLTRLEKKILSDFKLSQFIVCTDTGLASTDKRRFDDLNQSAFVTTQSIKKLNKYLKEWSLSPTGWHLCDDSETYDISTLDEEQYKDKVFFKERWINEDELEQKLIVTYSIKYKNYQREIRTRQIERAQNVNDSSHGTLQKANQNDYKGFIAKANGASDGEVADQEILSIHRDLISKEEAFDGFYAVCSNLDGDASAIIRINHRRWEIEECFRMMKSEFKARPVYLNRDDRVKAHFTTCFIALTIERLLEKRLQGQFTCHEIIEGLRNMNFQEIKGEGYVPTYTRTDLTDALHEAFGFRTDYQIVAMSKMKKIFKLTKNK